MIKEVLTEVEIIEKYGHTLVVSFIFAVIHFSVQGLQK